MSLGLKKALLLMLAGLLLVGVSRVQDSLNNDRDQLGLKVIAVGGAASVTEVQAFLNAGAYAALSASSAAWNPYLAAQIKQADASI